MSYIRKKKTKSGKIYAYEVTATWDSKKKQSRSVSKYIGFIDEDGQLILKGMKPKISLHKKKVPSKENLIQDFGNGFLISESIKSSAIWEPLSEVLSRHSEILSLMTYRLCQPGPMYNYPIWAEGTCLQTLGSNTILTSQHISRLLSYLGEESVQRSFFEAYLKQTTKGGKNIIIDASSLPTTSSSDFSAWGYNDGGIDTQFRFHCVVDQVKKRPLFYRLVPGNISDVSTLNGTVLELKSLGVKSHFALVDAGFCSEENLKILRDHKIDFLMRLPAGRKIYKEAILAHGKEIENLSNAYMYGKRSLFIKTIKVKDLYGVPGYLHMILDPKKKGKDLHKLLEERDNQNKNENDDAQDQLSFAKAGIFILISSKKIPTDEVLSAYYTRQIVEQIFGFSKSDLDLLPLRCHSDATIRGYLFLQFLLLVVFIELREKLKKEYTVEQAIALTRNLKCKVYSDQTIIQELSKSQKKIFDLASILVPKSISGI